MLFFIAVSCIIHDMCRGLSVFCIGAGISKWYPDIYDDLGKQKYYPYLQAAAFIYFYFFNN